MSVLLIVLIVLLLVGGIGTGPWMPYASTWGYRGPGILGLILLILLILALTGNITL